MKELLLKTFTNRQGNLNIRLVLNILMLMLVIVLNLTFTSLSIYLLLKESGAAFGSLLAVAGFAVWSGIIVQDWGKDVN